jgi:hypothetical protein
MLRPSALSAKLPQRFRALAQRLLRLAEGCVPTRLPSHLRRTVSQTMELDMTKGLEVGGPEAGARRVQCRGSYHDNRRCALQSQEVGDTRS